ncbi:hypothetical protein NE865_12686 [Phthorimaea operculella]|nr:hypothetical protein NE865_12686 [Phthorimaea operculella]
MLALCLRIPVSETDGHDFICNICVDKLTDCICFKKQALKSISILTSVDLCELLPAEELELLGLSEPEQIIELEVEHHSESEVLSDCDDITEDMSIISTEETKKKVKRKVIVNIPQTLGNATSPKVEGSPASLASPPRVSASPAPSRGRRSVGRPRTRSPALPYPVRRDERSCRECGLTCPTHITLKIHYNTHFGRHVCSFDGCDKRFMTRASLHKHAATHQTGPFRCDQCEQEFSKLNTYLSHKRLKHGASLPYRCGEAWGKVEQQLLVVTSLRNETSTPKKRKNYTENIIMSLASQIELFQIVVVVFQVVK